MPLCTKVHKQTMVLSDFIATTASVLLIRETFIHFDPDLKCYKNKSELMLFCTMYFTSHTSPLD